MNIVLWIVQGLLAFAMLGAGGMKLAKSKSDLAADPKMGWAADFTDSQIKLIGLAEALGAVGLVVPWVTGIAPVLTPAAAACLAMLMLGAAKTHLPRKEPFVVPVVIAGLCVFVAVFRSGLL